MPQELIIIFLLFFAVLAFAWFYLQRAKARTSTDADAAPDPVENHEAAPQTTPTEPPA